jgi:hypothetical protein
MIQIGQTMQLRLVRAQIAVFSFKGKKNLRHPRMNQRHGTHSAGLVRQKNNIICAKIIVRVQVTFRIFVELPKVFIAQEFRYLVKFSRLRSRL